MNGFKFISCLCLCNLKYPINHFCSICNTFLQAFTYPEISVAQYVFRLDDDSHILEPVIRDPIQSMMDQGQQYGYISVAQVGQCK